MTSQNQEVVLSSLARLGVPGLRPSASFDNRGTMASSSVTFETNDLTALTATQTPATTMNSLPSFGAVRIAHIPDAKNFQEVIEEWFQGQPSKGLQLPLKDWDKSMRNGHSISDPKEKKRLKDTYVN